MKQTLFSIVILASIAILFLSCNSKDSPNYRESLTSIKDVIIPDSVRVNEGYTIDAIVWGSSGCSDYSRYETLQKGDTTEFIIYEKVDSENPCTTIIIENSATFSHKIGVSGVHFLKFTKDWDSVFIDSVVAYMP